MEKKHTNKEPLRDALDRIARLDKDNPARSEVYEAITEFLK